MVDGPRLPGRFELPLRQRTGNCAIEHVRGIGLQDVDTCDAAVGTDPHACEYLARLDTGARRFGREIRIDPVEDVGRGAGVGPGIVCRERCTRRDRSGSGRRRTAGRGILRCRIGIRRGSPWRRLSASGPGRCCGDVFCRRPGSGRAGRGRGDLPGFSRHEMRGGHGCSRRSFEICRLYRHWPRARRGSGWRGLDGRGRLTASQHPPGEAGEYQYAHYQDYCDQRFFAGARFWRVRRGDRVGPYRSCPGRGAGCGRVSRPGRGAKLGRRAGPGRLAKLGRGASPGRGGQTGSPDLSWPFDQTGSPGQSWSLGQIGLRGQTGSGPNLVAGPAPADEPKTVAGPNLVGGPEICVGTVLPSAST